MTNDAEIADKEATWLAAAEVVYAVRDDVELRRSDPKKWREDYTRAAELANKVYADVEAARAADSAADQKTADGIAARVMNDRNPYGGK